MGKQYTKPTAEYITPLAVCVLSASNVSVDIEWEDGVYE